MTAGQSTRRLSNGSLAQAPLAALLAATLLSGALIGAGVTQYLGSTDAGTGSIGLEAQPAGTFDAPAFRAEERQLAGTFDAPAFRAEERQPLVNKADSGVVSSERRERVGGP